MQRNLPTLATGSAMRTPFATTGRLSILAALMADRSASTLPSMSATTPERSRIWPSLSNRPGFSWPLGPWRNSFIWDFSLGQGWQKNSAGRCSPAEGFMTGGLLGREGRRQIFGDGVEFRVGAIGAVIGHLVDQVLPALRVQLLLGGDFRGMA